MVQQLRMSAEEIMNSPKPTMRIHRYSHFILLIATASCLQYQTVRAAEHTNRGFKEEFLDSSPAQRLQSVIKVIDAGVIRAGMPISEIGELFGAEFDVTVQPTRRVEGLGVVQFRPSVNRNPLRQSSSAGWKLVVVFNSNKLVTYYYLTDCDSKSVKPVEK
jgi:hypothetical protein